MTSKSRLLLPPQPPPRFPLTPPTSSSSSPSTLAIGSALDVIVVVPSSHQSANKYASCRRLSSSSHIIISSSSPVDADDLPPLSSTNTAITPSPPPRTKGIVASSDFFVTFPSSLAWVETNNDNNNNAKKNSTSMLRKSMINKSSSSSSTNIRAFLYSRSKSFLSSVTHNNKDGCRKNNSEMEEEEEKTEEGIEIVGNGGGGGDAATTTRCYNTLETTSEWGTASTTKQNHHSYSYHPTKQRQHRKGNVQVQINGRYIPQLDMIFTAKRSYNNNITNNAMGNTAGNGSNGSGGGNSYHGDVEPTSCRFVAGNELRPATEILEMLLLQLTEEQEDESFVDDGQKMSCTCHAAIQASEFHLCPTQQDETNGQQQRISNAYSRGAILTPGRNLIRYTLFSQNGNIVATAEAHLYVWNSMDSVIVSDIDGTITKSDIRGVIDTIIQDKFEHVHDNICKLFHSIILDVGNNDGKEVGSNVEEEREEEEDYFIRGGSICKQQSSSRRNSMNPNNGSQVRFLYLSARPISLISQTRKFLQSVSQTCPMQQKIHNLPPGPILCHRSALSMVLYSELVAKNIHEFKADVLARQVVLPFVAARGEEECESAASDRDNSRKSITDIISKDEEPERSSSGRSSSMGRSLSGMTFASSHRDNRLFIAGFGNKMSDAIAYEMAGMDRSDIYIIDTESQILCVGINERISFDGKNDECISDPDEIVSVQNFDCCADPAECSFVEVVCCPGQIDNQIFSETIDSVQSNHATAPQLRHSESNVVDATTQTDCGDTSTSSDRARRRSSIKAFTSKIPLKKFPSFKLTSSMAKKPSYHRLFDGYGDPLLLERIRRRVVESEQI